MSVDEDDTVQILPAPPTFLTQQQAATSFIPQQTSTTFLPQQEVNVQNITPQNIPVTDIQQQQQQGILPSTSAIQTSGSGFIQNLLPQYLTQTGEGAKPKQLNIMIQRSQQQRASSLRTSRAGPVPEGRRIKDKPRFYCDECPANFSIKSELTRHKRKVCQKPEREFICESCEKEFYDKVPLKEHYFKEHLGKFLYHCTKCNQGFYYKSHKSTHKHACPNKDGPDLYPGKEQCDPEIEATFQRRRPISAEIPSNVIDVLQSEQKGSIMVSIQPGQQQQQLQQMKDPETNPMLPGPGEMSQDEISVEEKKEEIADDIEDD